MRSLVEAALAAQEERREAQFVRQDTRDRPRPARAPRPAARTCSVGDCGNPLRPHNRSGLCTMHGDVQRRAQHADVRAERRGKREDRRRRQLDPTLADTCAVMLEEWAASRERVGSVYATASEFGALVARMRAVGDRVRSGAK